MQLPECSVSECLLIPQLDSWVLDYSCRHRLEHLTKFCLEEGVIDLPQHGALPLRITSAVLWSIVKRRHTEHYERVLDFVNIIWHQAVDLISYRHYLKLSIAFKAKLVMEMFVKRQSLLDILQTLDKYFPKLVPDDPKATRRDIRKECQCRLQFRKLVVLLIRDECYRKRFLQDELEKEYGDLFMIAAQKLLWEFLERLESVLPRPRIDQLLATCVDVGCLSPGEQALVSVLVGPSTAVPDVLLTLMQRIRQQHSEDPSNPSRRSFEMEPGIPGISCSVESVLNGGHCPRTEQLTVEPWEEEQGNKADPTLESVKNPREGGCVRRRGEGGVETEGGRAGGPLSGTANEGKETENRISRTNRYSPGPSRKVYPLRGRGSAAKGRGSEHHGGMIGSSVKRLVFSALHFDQSSDEHSAERLFPSPPDPLQSQINLHSTSPVTASTSRQTEGTESQSEPVDPPGPGSNSARPPAKTPPGQTHSSCPVLNPTDSNSPSPNQACDQTPVNSIDLKAMAAAPLSREVQERILDSPLFQPKVLLLRLTVDQNGRPAAPERWGLRRDVRGGDGGHCQLGVAANRARQRSGQNPSTGRWNLRKRPRGSRLKAAETLSNRAAAEEQAMVLQTNSNLSLLLSSEESSPSDGSDYEYFPFCSQIKFSGRWTRYQKRKAIGQFIESLNSGETNRFPLQISRHLPAVNGHGARDRDKRPQLTHLQKHTFSLQASR